jgi:membrane protease YdiL (CAAX protease family)
MKAIKNLFCLVMWFIFGIGCTIVISTARIDLLELGKSVLDYALGLKPIVFDPQKDLLGLMVGLLVIDLGMSFAWLILLRVCGVTTELTENIRSNSGTFLIGMFFIAAFEEIVFRGVFVASLGNFGQTANLWVHAGAILFALIHVYNFKGEWRVIFVLPMFVRAYILSYIFTYLTFPPEVIPGAAPHFVSISLAVECLVLTYGLHLAFDVMVLMPLIADLIFGEDKEVKTAY